MSSLYNAYWWIVLSACETGILKAWHKLLQWTKAWSMHSQTELHGWKAISENQFTNMSDDIVN